MAKEVKVKEKWIIEKFESFGDEEASMELILRVTGKQMEWLRKKEERFWGEIEKIHGLDPEYLHKFDTKTKTITQLYKKPKMR